MTFFTLPVRILAAAALLALALIGLVVREGIARDQGREVVLPITGYDPRALLSGHYVRFQFRSEYPPGTRCPPGAGGFTARPRAWVALRRAGDHYEASGVALSRGEAARLGEVVVRGDVDCLQRMEPDNTWVILRLGVDRMHIDQARAETMGKALQATRDAEPTAQAVVSVGRDGKPRLKGLIVGGQRTDLSWF